MSQTTSHVLEPSAYADSFRRVGTVWKTSRITEEMNGMIMMASTRPAVSTPAPKNGYSLEKNFAMNGTCWTSQETLPSGGSALRLFISHGLIYVATNGAKMKRPHMP